MHVVRRLIVSILCCLALGVGMLAIAPTTPARAAVAAADTPACTDAKAAVTRAVKHERTTKHRVVLAKRALAKAKRTHRKARIAKARKAVRTRTRRHHRAVVALRHAREHRASACATTGGNNGGTTPTSGLGSLLALLTASLNGGSVPALDATQLTSLLDSLYPGASSALDPSDLTAILAAFDSAGSLDPTQLAGLLAGLPGADQLDPAQLVGLLAGGSLDPTALTGLLTTLTGALGDLGPTGLSNPTDAITAITGLLGTLLGGQTDPTQALGTLLGLLAAAGGGSGAIPGLDASQFTSLLNGLYPGASTALDPADLTTLFAAFPDAGSMNLTQLTDLLSGIGASGVDPAQLLAVLNGTPLSAGQATALTGSITALLSGVSGSSFTSPANPLATVGTLLQGLLGGILCGVLNLLC